jgi:flagellar protein FliO/FliZ
MSPGWLSIILVVLILAMIPMGLKWLQRRLGVGVDGVSAAARVISAVAVGPHQRVVTVEVGPDSARVWLTLGVTAQSINCLHTAAAPSRPMINPGETGESSPVVLTQETLK